MKTQINDIQYSINGKRKEIKLSRRNLNEIVASLSKKRIEYEQSKIVKTVHE
jgi:hypothetical protein